MVPLQDREKKGRREGKRFQETKEGRKERRERKKPIVVIADHSERGARGFVGDGLLFQWVGDLGLRLAASGRVKESLHLAVGLEALVEVGVAPCALVCPPLDLASLFVVDVYLSCLVLVIPRNEEEKRGKEEEEEGGKGGNGNINLGRSMPFVEG